jgi:cytochrome P450
VNKSNVYGLSRMIPLPNTFDTLDLVEHRRKRKIITQPISDRRLRTFEPTMIEEVDTFIDKLEEASSSSTPANMAVWCRNLAGDIIGQLAFGYPLNLLTEDTNRWLLPGLLLVTYRVNILMQFPLLQYLDPLVKFLGRKVRQRYVTVAETMIKARLALDKDAKHDFYSMVIDHLKVGSSLRDSELWGEGFLYISAGGNTTSATMAAMFFYLSRYPDCYARLAQEIRRNFHDRHEVTWDTKLRSCTYLRACINEALRIATPNSTILWREHMTHDEHGNKYTKPFVVDGHVVPYGTLVGVSLYALHHNADYYPDPFRFKPERWLDGGEERLNKAFAPFMQGSRACPGKTMAYQEISIAMARTFLHFDFEPASGDLGRVGQVYPRRSEGGGFFDEYDIKDIFNTEHDGPYLKFRSRTH